jgi:hypothetical protein
VYLCATAQSSPKPYNVFIVTLDGFRWQEVYTGADSVLIHDAGKVKDTSIALQQYWDSNAEIRRQKLLPFFWNVIAKQGQLYGNRLLNNKVDVANFYKISYPGYNEILTGYADTRFIPNTPVLNNNVNVLESLNNEPEYKGKVVAFASWKVLPYIINEDRSGFLVNGGYEKLNNDEDSTDMLIDKVQDNVAVKGHTRYDMLTYVSAKEYIQQKHPKVVFLGFGETDEYAHKGKYDMYLQKANDIDRMIGQLWYDIQTDPFYKGNTILIITTDHGRGKRPSTWWTHSFLTKGSGEAWMAIIGAGILPKGEMNYQQQTYQKQIAPTIANLLGKQMHANHPVGNPLNIPVEKPEIRLVAYQK